jgi:Cu-Zn family superoxide dismutase
MRAVAVFNKNVHGVVELYQHSPTHQTHIHFKLEGLIPLGMNACHVHTYGDMSDGCNSACDHYNPRGSRHGSIHIKTMGQDRHVGDLCNNLHGDFLGRCDFEYDDDLVDLHGPESVIGRMIVIHSGVDDLGVYRDTNSQRGRESSKTGNAGSRIACAVIGHAKLNL